ncbi:hypothetical protein [Nocardia brasiliensis]|uniref:hypothetical protein n=1 Tax=Nocardia brasiliensis TaxID=37326 RepID=UPI002455BB23|nr:hypothetical protein [Nocardia brasiliensis]
MPTAQRRDRFGNVTGSTSYRHSRRRQAANANRLGNATLLDQQRRGPRRRPGEGQLGNATGSTSNGAAHGDGPLTAGSVRLSTRRLWVRLLRLDVCVSP